MHWLRLRVSGRRTFSSDSQFSVSWSTCGGSGRGEEEMLWRGQSNIDGTGRTAVCERHEDVRQPGAAGGKEFREEKREAHRRLLSR